MKLALKKIARIAGGKVLGDNSIIITGIKSLETASPGDISFFADPRYRASLSKTKASVIIVSQENKLFNGTQLVVSNPSLAYARVAGLFAKPMTPVPGIGEPSFVHKKSSIGKNVSIHPMVFIGKETIIGDNTILCPGVYIGDRVKIGKDTLIYPNVSILEDCIIGNDVIIHAGTVIGSDGFGFVKDGPVSVKIPQIGIVQIDDHVEIGANNCIDRAALGKTWIKKGVKTDNMVHIAHNVTVGEDTIIVAQTGISGSVKIGREVTIGGQVALSDHIEVGDRAMIGSRSGVAKSVPSGKIVSGSPALPHRSFLKISGLKNRLPQFNERLRKLEKMMDKIEKRLDREQV